MRPRIVNFIITHCVIQDVKLIKKIRIIRGVLDAGRVKEAIDDKGAFQKQESGKISVESVITRNSEIKEIKNSIKSLHKDIDKITHHVEKSTDSWWEKYGLIITIIAGSVSSIVTGLIVYLINPSKI